MFLRRKWFAFQGLFRLPSGSQNVTSLFTKRVLSPHHLVGAVLGAGGLGTGSYKVPALGELPSRREM